MAVGWGPVVDWCKITESMVVTCDDVVYGVCSGLTTQIADTPVSFEDHLPSCSPVGGKSFRSGGTLKLRFLMCFTSTLKDSVLSTTF